MQYLLPAGCVKLHPIVWVVCECYNRKPVNTHTNMMATRKKEHQMAEKIIEKYNDRSVNMVGLLMSIMRWALEILNVDIGEVYLWDPEKQALVLRVAHGSLVEQHLGICLHVGDGLAGKVFASGKPIIVDNYKEWEGAYKFFGDPSSASELAVPLIFESQTIGVLIFSTETNIRSFSGEDIRLATLCANLGAVAIENARLYEQLHESVVRLRRTLEEEINERMADLAQRTNQIKGGAVLMDEGMSSAKIDELLGRVMELKITRKVLDEVSRIQTDSPPIDPLTPREEEVLCLIAKGLSNKEIERQLNIALSTVKYHVSSILSKLHVTDRTRAALWALDQGLVSKESSKPTAD